jgi:endonuclease YncB( thermonuclease family)
MYEYRAQVIKVTDGDTIVVRLDQGLRHGQEMAIRLYGINAPEIHVPDQHDAAVAAKNALTTLLLNAGGQWWPLVIRTIKDKADKYGGRWDGKVWRESADGYWNSDFQFVPAGPSVNEQMVATGHAVAYDGGKR